MQDLGKRNLALDKCLGWPAGQGQHRIADEHHAPKRINAATKSRPRNVFRQRAVLLLAAAQQLFHRFLVFAGRPHFIKQVAVAQIAVHDQHQQAQAHRDNRHRNRQHGLHRNGHRLASGVQLGDRLGKAQRGNAGVVHGGNRTAHHHPGQHPVGPGAKRQKPLQPKAHPQRQGRQHHGHHQRQHKAPQVVAHERGQLRGGHAHIVHGANARAHQHGSRPQHRGRKHRPHQHTQRHPRGKNAGQHRQQGHPGIKPALPTHGKSQHADVVHGPHATAQGQGPRGQGQVFALRTLGLAGQLGHVHGHGRSAGRNQHRQQHQPRVVLRPQQRIGGPALHKKLSQHQPSPCYVLERVHDLE